jgi:ribosomal-protein-alanine N-acetyltransferase
VEVPDPGDEVIRTARLDLVRMSPALMRAVLAADWPQAARLLGAEIPEEWREADWGWLSRRPAEVERDPALASWLPCLMLLRSLGPGSVPVVVGEVGFHGPPDGSGRIELGYTVVAAHRRQGFAEEAVRGLLSWAELVHGVHRFRACVSPDNVASLNLVRKLGFVAVGRHRHVQRGEEVIFHRDLTASPAGGRS